VLCFLWHVFCFWFTRLGCEYDGYEMEVMRGVVVATNLRWGVVAETDL
jgi:hypothetical protein